MQHALVCKGIRIGTYKELLILKSSSCLLTIDYKIIATSQNVYSFESSDIRCPMLLRVIRLPLMFLINHHRKFSVSVIFPAVFSFVIAAIRFPNVYFDFLTFCFYQRFFFHKFSKMLFHKTVCTISPLQRYDIWKRLW